MARSHACALAGAAMIVAALPCAPSGRAATTRHFSASQLFEMADQAQAARDPAAAETIYHALEHDPDIDIRNEARFRHAKFFEQRKAFADAAALLRKILDDRPKAQPARLELAKVLALMGREGDARRELRQAEAGGLPPEVQRIVNQFAAALSAAQPFGGSLEMGFAPSSNVNRATSSTILNSTLGPLDLSTDARAQSGIGIDLAGQAYVQLPVLAKVALTAQVATQNTLFRASQFDDSTFSGALGAILGLGGSQFKLSAGPSYRLYGGHPYNIAVNATLDWQHPLGKRSQLNLESDFSSVTYKTNALQDGNVFGETLGLDHAFSARFGGKLSLLVQRATAADPGYATAMGGGGLLAWREIGKTTLYWNGAVSHLESDARLFLYSDRRREWLYRTGIGATFRQLQVRGFAPLVRLNYERNVSTVGIYDYRRLSADVAITRAF